VGAGADRRAAAPGRCARAALPRSCSSRTRTPPNTRPWSRPPSAAQRAPLDLLNGAGAIASPYQFHWQRFLFEHFPKGTGFPRCKRRPVEEALPLAAVQAFSIDDSATTEIDDALSVQGLGTGTVVFGIHIAAPGLAIAPDSAPSTKWPRERLSTVYMPGYKLTMLPDEVVQAYTLQEGRELPGRVACTSRFDEATLVALAGRPRVERVPIAANLRHDQLDDVVTEAALHRAERRPSLRLRARTGLCLSAWPGISKAAARSGARQTRDLQPARLQLQAGPRRR
jgi:hypothetical protein